MVFYTDTVASIQITFSLFLPLNIVAYYCLSNASISREDGYVTNPFLSFSFLLIFFFRRFPKKIPNVSHLFCDADISSSLFSMSNNKTPMTRTLPDARHRRHLSVRGGGRGGRLQVSPLCHGTTGGLRSLGSLKGSGTSYGKKKEKKRHAS